MYFYVRPPLPFGAGSLSSYFFYSLPSVLIYLGYQTILTGFSQTLAACCFFQAYYLYLFSFYYFSFFFFQAYYFFFLYYYYLFLDYLVYLSQLILQLLTMIYSAFFWLAKKSVFLLKKPKTVSKKASIFPFCWIMVMRIPSNFVSSVVI